MKKRILKISSYIFFILIVTLFFLSFYIYFEFENIPFSQILFSIKSAEGTSQEIINNGIIYVTPKVIITVALFIWLQWIIKRRIISSGKKIIIKFKAFKKEFKYRLFYYEKNRGVKLYWIIIFILLIFIIKFFRIDSYIYYMTQNTKIYEEKWIAPYNVEVTFNDNKRNLIYIVLESEETTAASIQNGGAVQRSYIPNLEKIALENTNFSNTDKLGGAIVVPGAEYTMGSIVSQTSGTPVAQFLANNYHGYSKSFPGLYTLGEFLEKNGYKNYLMMGSSSDFSGISDYFSQHGNYKIMDYNYAVNQKWIDKNYYVWWGYEDNKLFEFSKQQLTEIAKNEEPFNFTMITIDTHFTDGYYDVTCGPKEFDDPYASVFYCNDGMIGNFIKWIQEQEWYKDTTIVISGDHLTMQKTFYSNISSDYQRTVYTSIINSAIKNPENTKNRLYSAVDFYPTTLAAIGATIDGEKLGFGVNLYSDKKTLIEELGFNYVNEELQKNSNFYNTYILGETYYEFKNNNGKTTE